MMRNAQNPFPLGASIAPIVVFSRESDGYVARIRDRGIYARVLLAGAVLVTTTERVLRRIYRKCEARLYRVLAHAAEGGGGNDRFPAVGHLQRLEDGGEVNLRDTLEHSPIRWNRAVL